MPTGEQPCAEGRLEVVATDPAVQVEQFAGDDDPVAVAAVAFDDLDGGQVVVGVPAAPCAPPGTDTDFDLRRRDGW